MDGKPAARVTDPTACPLPGHGINPIVSGSPDVLFDNLPAARLTDKTACGSSIASAVSSTVWINGLNAAMQGSVGDHGNVVMSGSCTVIIGNSGGGAAFSPIANMPVSFDDKFQLIDKTSGEPLPNHSYAIKRASGEIEHGVTDDLGYTHPLNANHAENIEIYLED